MSFIQKIVPANQINHGSTVISGPKAGALLSSSYVLIDDSCSRSNINGVQSTGALLPLDNKLDNVRFYTGDTAN